MTPSPRPLQHLPRLRYRTLRAGDLAQSLQLLPEHIGLSDGQRSRLPALWERLAREPSILTGTIEDSALPDGQNIQAWGVTMALPQPLVQALDLEGNPRGHLVRRIYAGLLAGEVQLMNDRDIGLANARGELVLMILHFSMREHDLSDPYVHKLVAVANDSFRVYHSGYNLRALYFENSAAAAPLALSSGFAERRLADHDALQALDPQRRPALYALTREEARQQLPGPPARNCFEHQPPRFLFNASQRRLLWQAIFDDSDELLMATLEVSTHGLKKLWRGVYDRIEDVEPEFFGEAVAEDDGKRGPEKRRQVLAYLRQRPEELRPWVRG